MTKIYFKLFFNINEDDCVKYKFIPNEDFDKLIKDSLLHKEDKLVITALDRLKSAFINTYKDIL